MDKESNHEGIKTTLTAADVRRHIEMEGSLNWIKMKDLLEASPESCVDGRGIENIIGTPGGNAGEFILALTAAEEAGGQKIQLDKIDEILSRYLDKAGKFYLHTDDHALRKAGLTKDEARRGSVDKKRRKDLLTTLADPANGGCGHLRLMAQNPNEYEVRPELVAEAMKAIYQALWDGKDIEFVILEGGHNEGAVVNIVIDGEEVTAETQIPTISPTIGDVQMFVNHPQAASFMRKETARYMADVTGWELDLEKFIKQTEQIGNKQLVATIGHLADGLPIFTAHFKSGKLDKIE